MFKQKRAYVGTTNTPLGAAGFNQPLGRDANGATTSPGNQAMGAESNDPLLKITIDNALSAGTTMNYNEFVAMVQKMEFNVYFSSNISRSVTSPS